MRLPNKVRGVGLALALVLRAGDAGLRADAPTSAPAGTAASQPAVDRLIEDLMKIEPKAIGERLTAVQQRIAVLAAENTQLKEKIAANEAESARLTAQIQLLEALGKVRGTMPAPVVPPAPQAVATAPATAPAAPVAMAPPAAPPVPATPAASPAPPPAAAMPAKPEATAPEIINYTDHILPIINEKCAGCHNPDKARGGLVLVTYNDAMNGGSSGKVIVPGSAEQSRLFKLVAHLEEPHMPPMQSKLDDAKLDLIKRWIDMGAGIDKNAKPIAQKAVPADAMMAAAPVDAETAPMPVDLPKGPLKKALNPLPASAMAMSPVAPLLAVGGNRQIAYYEAKTRELLGVLDYPEGRIEHLSFSRDGTWLVAAGGEAGKSGTVVVFDVESGRRVGQFDRHYDTVLTAAVSPDNALVAVGGTNAKVRVFDAYTGVKAYEVTAHNEWIQAVEFSPDGLLLATADRAGMLYVWDGENGREMHSLRGHGAGITALSFRPDSQMLASTSRDGTLRLWDMESGRQIRSWGAHGVAALWVEFAPNGQLGTCGADGLTRLWDQEGKKLREYENQGDWVYRVAFTPDAAEIIAGTFNGTLAMFETATGRPLGNLSTAP